jgi:hypothetical protein
LNLVLLHFPTGHYQELTTFVGLHCPLLES